MGALFCYICNTLDVINTIYICKNILNYRWSNIHRTKVIIAVFLINIFTGILSFIVEVYFKPIFGIVYMTILWGSLCTFFEEKRFNLLITAFTLANFVSLFTMTLEVLYRIITKNWKIATGDN